MSGRVLRSLVIAASAAAVASMASIALAGEVARAQSGAAAAREAQHWVSAWGTAEQLAPEVMPRWARPPKGVRRVPPADSPVPPTPEHLRSETVRMVVRTTIAGSRVRIQLSNAYGKRPVHIGDAHVALHTQGSAIAPGSDRRLTVAGRGSFTLPPGAAIVTDPVNLELASPAELAVSLYVQGDSGPVTVHPLGLHTTYVTDGDTSGSGQLTSAEENASYFWLSGVDVLPSAATGVVIAFGDSITDGFRTTRDANLDWPAVLADRLRAAYPGRQWAVLNMGYSGNRVLRDGAGVSALARFDRDALTRLGARWIILLEGINDIGWAALPGAPEDEQVTADDLIGGYRELIERAHLHGLKVMGATLTPFLGVNTYTSHGEAIRDATNRWIRTSGAFDAVVDFDAVTRDPADPRRLRAGFDSGDHIHPNDAGNRAMAGAIDLATLMR